MASVRQGNEITGIRYQKLSSRYFFALDLTIQEIEKSRFGLRLTALYIEERKRAASVYAKNYKLFWCKGCCGEKNLI